jgi:hypothetical protein
MAATIRLTASRFTNANDLITVDWFHRDGVWHARRQMPGVNRYAPLPQLDTEVMMRVFGWMRDITTGIIDEKLITPDPSFKS